MSMSEVLQKLKDRKLGQWTLAYLGGMWVLLQIVGLFAEQLGWPPIVFKSATVLLGVGFPAMLVLAWYHGEKGRQRVGGVELLMLATLLIIAGAALTLVRGRSTDGPSDGATADAADEAASPTANRARSLATRRLTATSGLQAHPTWSPDGRSFAYVSDESGNRDLWVHSLDGGRDTQITSDSADDTQPAWSPDARRIAFASSRDHGPRLDQSVQYGYSLGGGIWSVPATGGTPTRLVDGGFNPSWSPRGRRLVFDASLDGARRIWTVSNDGSDPIRISTDRSDGAVHTRPKWSPDGSWIVYERQEGSLTTSSNIELVPAEGGTAKSVVQDGSRNLAPTWANDSTLVFVSDRSGALNLWAVTIDPTAGTPRRAPEQLTTGAGNDVDPSVSPSRDAIAFSVTRFRQDLWSVRMDPQTGEAAGLPASLLQSAWNDVAPAHSEDGTLVIASDRDGSLTLWRLDTADARPVAITDSLGSDMQPDWSPDGQRIAFFSDRSGNNDIWVVPGSGGTAVQLTTDAADDSNPYWSPDGGRLAFMSDRSGSQQIWVMNADGSNPRRITDVGVTAHTARWSPDGEWILFTSMDEGTRDIWVVRPANGETRRLTEGAGQNAHPLWSADGTFVLFLADHRIVRAVPLGGGESRVVFDPNEDRIDFAHLSRDGTQLFFTVREVEGDLFLLEGLSAL